jgi:hypothetical protein
MLPSWAILLHSFETRRVPQILRSLDILQYSKGLSERIDSFVVIPWGTDEESAIRAATVIAVERIRERLSACGVIELMAIELDWLLWNKGEILKDELRPHHRTLSIYY